MRTPAQLPTSVLSRSVRSMAVALALVCAVANVPVHSAHAQTFTVLHAFAGAADGGNPYAGLTLDRGGNLYGTTTTGGGRNGAGTVFKMTNRNGAWTFAPLYDHGGYAGVTIGPNDTLYVAGFVGANGAVFNLKPPPRFSPNPLAPWTATVLYSFQGGPDGGVPYSAVTFDQAGNIYDTTYNGGNHDRGTVFELSPSDGGWTKNVLYTFSGIDGSQPFGDVIIDAAGNIYGTTLSGGNYPLCPHNYQTGCGTVFELTPTGSGSWTKSFLYSFHGGTDGANPYAGRIFGASGNVYGANPGGYDFSDSTVFELMPSGGTSTFSLAYSFGYGGVSCGPRGALVMDGAGNLYGTTYCLGAHGSGSVFKLTPINGGWTATTLYSFTGGSDGLFPESNVVVDANGNLYGTTTQGGTNNNGVVWEITP
jgi:uncharacterized repeat protein (TIGR03803 family)